MVTLEPILPINYILFYRSIQYIESKFVVFIFQDDNKIEVQTTVENDKDKYERESKKIKKDLKEKESAKRKYDKKSGK